MNVTWGHRSDSRVQHVAIVGRGRNDGRYATACNAKWIQRHVLSDWTFTGEATTTHRPCLLCIGWYVRNGSSWRPMMEWLRAEAAVGTPNTPREVRT